MAYPVDLVIGESSSGTTRAFLIPLGVDVDAPAGLDHGWWQKNPERFQHPFRALETNQEADMDSISQVLYHLKDLVKDCILGQ